MHRRGNYASVQCSKCTTSPALPCRSLAHTGNQRWFSEPCLRNWCVWLQAWSNPSDHISWELVIPTAQRGYPSLQLPWAKKGKTPHSPIHLLPLLQHVTCHEENTKLISKRMSFPVISCDIFAWFLAAGIPAPVYFGALIDKTCLKWGSTSCGQRGACRLYDSDAYR